MAFIFADLIVLPIVAIYRKYYGWPFTVRIVGLMLLTMTLAALAIDALFSAADLIPTTRPSRDDIFGSVELDYKLLLNLLGTIAFTVLFWLSRRDTAATHSCPAHAQPSSHGV
jgi:hypothetical protein